MFVKTPQNKNWICLQVFSFHGSKLYNELPTEIRQGIGVLRFLSKYLPRHTVNEMYKLYVRPHPDYDDIIHYIPRYSCEYNDNGILSNLMEKLESIQWSAALAVTGVWKGTSREKLYNELGWESLNLRRWSSNKLTPDYTRCPIPHLCESHYDLRRHASIGQIQTRFQAILNRVFIPTAYLNGKSSTLRLGFPVR